MKRKPNQLSKGNDLLDPVADCPRGETEFEEAWIKCDFQLVFSQVAELGLASLKDTYEFVYRKAFVAGKNRRDLSHESIGTPISTPLLEKRRGPQKENNDGVTTSD